MSNLAMANLTPAAAPRQAENATGKTAVAKKDSVSSKTTQVDEEKQVTDLKEGVDAGMSPAKGTGKFSFNDLLKKHLAHDTSNDKSDTLQSPKQTIVDTEVTSDKKTAGEKNKKQTTDNLVPVMSFLPQALQTSKTQAIPGVTNTMKLQGQSFKIAQLAKTPAVGSSLTLKPVAVEKTKVVDGKEVTTTKVTAKEPKATAKEPKAATAAVEKAVNDTVKTKEAAVSGQTIKIENIAKNTISEPNSNVSQVKQGAEQTAMNLSAESNTVGKDKLQLTYSQSQAHTATEVTKTDKSKSAAPKIPEKAQVSTTAEHSDAAQTVAATRTADVAAPILNSHARTETVTAKQVTTTPTAKADIGQAVLTPSEQIIDKVQNTITGSTQQIQVTLSPAELGMVRITFRQQDGQIEGLMEFQNPEVRKDVENALPQITAALAQNGIQLRRMEIVPMQNQQSNQESFQSPQQEFNPADQHYLGEQGNSGGTGKMGERISGRDVQLADGLQGQAQQGYDLSGLNMYA